MNRPNCRWLIVAATCLAMTAAGIPVAVAEEEAPAIGHGFHSGTIPLNTTFNGEVYQLKDPTRANMSGYYAKTKVPGPLLLTDPDNDWGNGILSDAQTQAVDAQYALSKAWDYFANVHGRVGVAGNGQAIDIYGFAPEAKENGGFYTTPEYQPAISTRGSRLVFGNPTQILAADLKYRQVSSATLDLVGTAFSRGVVTEAAGLPYGQGFDEPTALALGTATIFGTMIEFYANHRVDRPDYLVGERMHAGFPAGTFDAPASMADPAKTSGHRFDNCWTSGNPSHYLATHFFYLLAVGSNPQQGDASPICNTMSVTGIGNDKAAKIWYRALTQYFTPSTTYAAARVASLKAAADLHGAHSLEYNTVNSAWAAVSVTGVDPFPGGQTPYPVNPLDQETAARTAATLQLEATNPGGRTLTYSAAGLPPGLTINPVSGLISGTPTTAGDYKVTVGVTDTVHAQGTTWFMWYVN
jgi:Zn-dependent metalloprotease